MRVKIAKWGNSLAVRIPREALEKSGLKEGQEVELEARAGEVELKSVAKRYTLEELVAEMRRLGPQNEPELVDWGPDRGAEILPEDDWSDIASRDERPETGQHAARRR